MDGLGLFIAMVFGSWFIPPLLLFIVGIVKRRKDSQAGKGWFILGVVWLLCGGGICASLLLS